MSDLLQNNSFNEHFKREFPEIDLKTEIVSLGEGNAHTLFIYIKNEEELTKDWIPITNNVALHYQKKLIDPFDKWNIYLFFLVTEPSDLSDDIRYTIENNTFSSRKIIPYNDITTTTALIEKYIHNRLTIETSIEETSETPFEYNPIIWDALKDKTIKKTNTIPKEQEKTYKELLEKLREQI